MADSSDSTVRINPAPPTATDPPEYAPEYAPTPKEQNEIYPNLKDYPTAYPQAPPPYAASSPLSVQSETNGVNTTVVQQVQPIVDQCIRHYGIGDHGLLYSVASTMFIFLCGGWCGLFCTCAGIYIAVQAQDAEHRGDQATMRSQSRLSITLTSVGLVCALFSLGFYFVGIFSQ